MKAQRILITLLLLNSDVISFAGEPANNSTFHYNSIYFTGDFVGEADYYRLLLTEDSTSNTIIQIRKIPAFRQHHLKWGRGYHWKIQSCRSDSTLISETEEKKFNISGISYQNFDEIKMKVIKNDPSKHAGGLIAIDYTRSVFDREGKVVWTIPLTEGLVHQGTNIRDLKITKDNTLTFLTIPVPVEMDFEGNVVWKAPYPFTFRKDTIIYHHQFEKTPRGTYLVLGDRKVWRKLNHKFAEEDIRPEFDMKVVKGAVYRKILLAVLLEFDHKGRLLWWWDANDYVKDEDLVHIKNKRGLPVPATHANAFGESPDGKKIFVGFRDLSRIVVIDKASRKVEYSYGEKFPSGEARVGHGLFKHQHDAKLTKRQSFFILNNNGALSMDGISSIMELRQRPKNGDSLVLWRFSLDFDTLSKGKSLNGGNVNELPNQNILLCGGALNRIFEVTRKKEIVWDAFLYGRGKKDTLWQDMSQYRCSWIPLIRRSYFLVESVPVPTDGPREWVIHNTGNYEDQYEIQLLDKNYKRIRSMKSGPIAPDSHSAFNIGVKTPAGTKILRIRSFSSRKVVDISM